MSLSTEELASCQRCPSENGRMLQTRVLRTRDLRLRAHWMNFFSFGKSLCPRPSWDWQRASHGCHHQCPVTHRIATEMQWDWEVGQPCPLCLVKLRIMFAIMSTPPTAMRRAVVEAHLLWRTDVCPEFLGGQQRACFSSIALVEPTTSCQQWCVSCRRQILS